MPVSIIQLRGCTKCRNECLNLPNLDNSLKLSWNEMTDKFQTNLSTVILTGYVLLEDKPILEKIRSNAQKVILFGTCATHGGIFGLQNQKGKNVRPISSLIKVDAEVAGCLGSSAELITKIESSPEAQKNQLCSTCNRESSCDFLTEVIRQYDPDEFDEEQCMNDKGLLCSGVIAADSCEKCIDFNTPCRGCKPMVSKSGTRMLGMFGTLMGQLDVATEASSRGATDKLADAEDEISSAFLDLVGNFFRFTLASSPLPKGKQPSSEDEYQNIFEHRVIEEIPSIMAMMGGNRFISNTLDILEAYETTNQLAIPQDLLAIRQELRQLEKEYQKAIQEQSSTKYKEVSNNIRHLAGNMNLSNLGFGGLKMIPESMKNDHGNLEPSKPISYHAGTYSAGEIEYSLDNQGIVTKWNGGN